PLPHAPAHHHAPPPFPTRRSSDLIRATDRPNQTRDSALSRRCARPVTSINNCFAISFAATTFSGHLFVEGIIEQHDLARDFVPRHRFQFVKISDGDQFGGNSIRRCRDACAERAQNNFLRRVLHLSRKLNERCCFFAAHPVRHHHSFELHFAAEDFHFTRNVLN